VDSRICQVAFSALHGRALRRWYVEAFGLVPSGGIVFGGPATSRVQGVPLAAELCTWALDSQHVFQLEFFDFFSPKPLPRPEGRRPSDLGYGLLSFHTEEFDAVLDRLFRLGTPNARAVGSDGARRAAVQDPEGNWVQVLEADPLDGAARSRRGVRSTLRIVRLTVRDLAASRERWMQAFALRESTRPPTNLPEHEELWGLAGARRDVCVLEAGGVLLELAQYHDPPPRSSDRRICDQGIMNVAFGFSSTREFDAGLSRAERTGFRPNGRPLDAAIFKVMYVNDPLDGQSVELLFPRPWAYGITGFVPSISARLSRLLKRKGASDVG
jgi:hypothetical protein